MTTQKLFAHSLPPHKGGAPKQLVILLHGYGANGRDLLSLGEKWAEHLPETEFLSPNAPFNCGAADFEGSYQWFPLDSLEPDALVKEVQRALPSLQTFIASELKKRNLTESDLALVGFSQGTIMALSAGLTREKCAGVLGYSGTYVHDESLGVKALPEILLIHGEDDEVISVDHMSNAAKTLASIGVNVRTHVCRDLEHGISSEGLEMGGEFLQSVLEK